MRVHFVVMQGSAKSLQDQLKAQSCKYLTIFLLISRSRPMQVSSSILQRSGKIKSCQDLHKIQARSNSAVISTKLKGN